MSKDLTHAARAIGCKGGASNSAAKAAASRGNGALARKPKAAPAIPTKAEWDSQLASSRLRKQPEPMTITITRSSTPAAITDESLQEVSYDDFPA